MESEASPHIEQTEVPLVDAERREPEGPAVDVGGDLRGGVRQRDGRRNVRASSRSAGAGRPARGLSPRATPTRPGGPPRNGGARRGSHRAQFGGKLNH